MYCIPGPLNSIQINTEKAAVPYLITQDKKSNIYILFLLGSIFIMQQCNILGFYY